MFSQILPSRQSFEHGLAALGSIPLEGWVQLVALVGAHEVLVKPREGELWRNKKMFLQADIRIDIIWFFVWELDSTHHAQLVICIAECIYIYIYIYSNVGSTIVNPPSLFFFFFKGGGRFAIVNFRSQLSPQIKKANQNHSTTIKRIKKKETNHCEPKKLFIIVRIYTYL